MAVTIPGLAIKIDGDASGLQKTLDGINAGIKNMFGPATLTAVSTGISTGLQIADRAFQTLANTIATAERGLAKFMETAGRLGKIEDLAAQLNINAGDLIGLNRGASRQGSSPEDLQKAILAMRRRLGEAAMGGKDPFAEIGLSLRKLSMLTASGQLGEVFEALNNITDPARRQAIGEDIFGKMFRSIELLSRGGKAGITEWIEEAKRLGITIDAAMLDRIGRAEDALGDVGLQLQTMTDKLVGAFAPALERVGKSLSKIFGDMSKDGGVLDKLVSRTEALVQFTGLYVNELKNLPEVLKLLPGGEAAAGAAPTVGRGWLLGPLAPLMDVVGGTLGEATERSNSLDAQLAQRKQLDAMKQQQKDIAAQIQQASVNSAFAGVRGFAEWIGSGIVEGAKIAGGAQEFAKKFLADQDKQGRPGAMQYAGALEMGTAAAYAAAYRVDQNAPEKEIAKNTAKSTSLLDKATGYLSDLVKKMPSLAPARLT